MFEITHDYFRLLTLEQGHLFIIFVVFVHIGHGVFPLLYVLHLEGIHVLNRVDSFAFVVIFSVEFLSFGIILFKFVQG